LSSLLLTAPPAAADELKVATPGSRVDLVRSRIGMVVRNGAARPDISTVDALVRTLRATKSIAYSSSASGVYLATDLFKGPPHVCQQRASPICANKGARVR
jgi:hypothetical protein